MSPVIALVGRPNVGKSTLFNALTRSRDALVADMPGLTRDRHYGVGKRGSRPYRVLDTGGLTGMKDGIDALVAEQAWQAVTEADAVLLLVDGREGPNTADEEIARRLRRLERPLFVVVNKSENLSTHSACAEFHALGLGDPVAISASHQQGIDTLLERVFAVLPSEDEPPPVDDDRLRLAIIGRPNVGKSTLVNRLLGEERVLAYDQPGTTRDSIEIPFDRDERRYLLVDTAGVRRRSRVQDAVEKFSIIKTLQSLERANVAILVVDAHQGIGEQDAHLVGHVLDSGRALVVAVNKWDHLSQDQRNTIHRELDRKLDFLRFARLHFISALHGSGVMDLLESAQAAYDAAMRRIGTSVLNRALEEAVRRHQPPLVKGHTPKLRYAHQGGENPPRIVIHGTRVGSIPNAYRRYLMNYFRTTFDLWGTPVVIEFRSGENPYDPSTQRLKPRYPKRH